MFVNFVSFSREFVITVIVKIEFDCNYKNIACGVLNIFLVIQLESL